MRAQTVGREPARDDRFQTLTERAPVGMFEVAPTGVCTWVNAHWSRITGLDATAILGRRWTEALHEDDRQRARAAWDDAVSGGGEFALECRVRLPDGRIQWVAVRTTPVRDGEGRVSAHVGGVSELGAARASSDGWGGFDTAREPMFVASPDGRLIRVNPALEELLGRPESSLLGVTLSSLFHADEREAAAADLARATDGGVVSSCECRVMTAAGAYRWLRITVAADPAAGVLYGSGRDVSARRNAEATQAALLRIAQAVAAGAHPDAVFQAVAEELPRLFHVEAGVVLRLEEGHGLAVGSTGAHDVRVGSRVPLGLRGALAHVCATGRPGRVEVDRMPQDDPIRLVYERNGYRASVAAPVVVASGMWGAVLASTTRADPFPDDAEDRLNLFSQLVSTAIANADAQRRVAAHADEQAALARVATLVAEEAEPDEVLALAAEEVARLLGVDASGVVRFDQSLTSGILAAAWSGPGLPRSEVGARIPLTGATAAAAVFRTGRPARIDGDSGRDRQTGMLTPTSPFRRDAAAPIRVDGRLWGAVSVGLVGDRRLAGDAEERLARFAHLVGLAISSTEARARLAVAATTDPLTGLLNRGAFQERLGSEMARAARHGHPLCLAILDIDHFKGVNDAHGHQAGDRVLIEVARRLEALSRNGETLSRVGGEEFGWILPETNVEGALAAAERARRAVGETPIDGIGPMTVSIGIGERIEGSSPEEIFRDADAALYRAKDDGRDRVRAH